MNHIHALWMLLFQLTALYRDWEQREAALVMEDLMEWSGDVSNYPYVALQRVIMAM